MSHETTELFNPEVLTNQRPTIIYVDDQTDTDIHQSEITYLKNDLKCQVLTASERDIYNKNKEIQFLVDTRSVVLFLVKEGEFDKEDSDFPQYIFEHIRDFSSNIPILFIPHLPKNTSAFNILNEESDVFVESNEDRIFKLIKQQLKKFRRNPNYFGVENINSLIPMARRILKSYENSDHDNGASSSNDQTIIQAINIRVNAPEHIKSIFDANLNPADYSYLELSESVIDIEALKMEKQRIRNYSEEEKEKFVFLVRDSKNFDSEGNRLESVIGLGDYVKGFAIDSKTLEYQITGSGGHRNTERFLTSRILPLEYLQGNKNAYNQEDTITKRFISGFIYPHVQGFSSPILVTDYFNSKKNRYQSVVNFLNRQNFITVSQSGNLIE